MSFRRKRRSCKDRFVSLFLLIIQNQRLFAFFFLVIKIVSFFLEICFGMESSTIHFIDDSSIVRPDLDLELRLGRCIGFKTIHKSLLCTSSLPVQRTPDCKSGGGRIPKWIMNCFATLFPFLIRVSPLRWLQVFGTGSAILAAFLALAGAAWYLDLSEPLLLNLFNATYWLFLYVAIYIDIRWCVYDKTREWILKTCLFQKMKRTFMLKARFRDFFLIASFFLFTECFSLMFPNPETEDLVNPLQVIAQLSCILLHFKYDCYEAQKHRRVKHLLILFLLLSVLGSLHLRGKDWEILSLVLCTSLPFIFFLPLDGAYFLVFFGLYFLDQELAKWGFCLVFQQVCYYALSFFLDKELSTPNQKKGLFSLIFVLLIQGIFGFFYYGDCYLAGALKLAALLSGACIIFLSLKRRQKWAIIIPFLLYFVISLIIGVFSSPSETTTIWGIPHGILIFFILHFWPLLGLFIFKDSLPRRKQALVPLFFSAVFFVLGYFPELAWLEKWIEGMDLLLLFLGVISFIEEQKRSRKVGGTWKKRSREVWRKSGNRRIESHGPRSCF